MDNNIDTLINSYIKSRDELISISEELWAISFLGDEENYEDNLFDGCQIGDDGLNHRDISGDIVNIAQRIEDNTKIVNESFEGIIESYKDAMELILKNNPRKSD